MRPITEEYIASIIAKVIPTLNLSNTSYTLQKLEDVAQNYFGVIIPVRITGTESNVEKTVELILKLAPTDERYRVSGAVTLMFARELYIYSKLLKSYSELQENFKTKLITPKCYYINKEYCEEAIVMQNMCQASYKPFTQKPFLDIDHIKVSLRALANFHALSFILQEKDPNLYEEASSVCVPLSEKNNKRFMEILVDRLSKAILKFENTEHWELLEGFRRNCVKYVEASTFAVHKLCICHGDIWKENILFQYENDKPLNVCLIDYQTARMCSPAFDALYLIASSTDSELRRNHFEELLAVYYDQFTEMLREAGLGGEVYSREAFDDDLKIVGPACFIIANTALWLSNGLQEEGHVRSKHVFSTDEEKQAAVNTYRSIIRNLIEDFSCRGYLRLTE